MKAKIDYKHRIRIPNQIWDACNFTENKSVDVQVNKFGELTVGKISKTSLKLKHVCDLYADILPWTTAKATMQKVELEFRCIVVDYEIASVDKAKFDVVCDASCAHALKAKYGKK